MTNSAQNPKRIRQTRVTKDNTPHITLAEGGYLDKSLLDAKITEAFEASNLDGETARKLFALHTRNEFVRTVEEDLLPAGCLYWVEPGAITGSKGTRLPADFQARFEEERDAIESAWWMEEYVNRGVAAIQRENAEGRQ